MEDFADIEINTITQLTYKIWLKKKLKVFTYDDLFESGEFMMLHNKFINTKIGKAWLKKPAGQAYQAWLGAL